MTEATPQVEVLLATYNGARYLRQQVESVLAQRNVTLRILAHDDGSTDGTLDILRHYATLHPQTFLLLEDNVITRSAKGNFHHLLRASTAPYIAFCDQDDVWLPDKLQRSLEAMTALQHQHGEHLPLLVYTDLKVVSEDLHVLSNSLWHSNSLQHPESPSLAELLTENVVTGCTALLNRELVQRMQTMPPTAQMHDHWAALLAASLGALKAIPAATVLYRQHDANVVGAIRTGKTLKTKLLRFISSEGIAARARQYELDRAQAENLLTLHGDAMSSHARSTLAAFSTLPSQSRLQRLRSMNTYALWRPDTQRKAAQAIDLMLMQQRMY